LSKSVEDQIDNMKEKDRKIEKFSDLLDSLSTTEEKKKLLWKEVYENALNDRESANTLFTDLLIQSKGNAGNHTMFGQLMSKYLERMSKSNDQILRLAEIISKEEQESIDPNAIFDQIRDQNG
jgi:hypothetical protein